VAAAAGNLSGQIVRECGAGIQYDGREAARKSTTKNLKEEAMHYSKIVIAGAVSIAALVGTLGVQSLFAQQPGFSRTPLQKGDLSVAGREAVQVRAEFDPDVAAGRHTHPGEELGYVLEGTLVVEIEGKAPLNLKAGDTFFVPAGTVHDGKNVGAGKAKVLATYIVEKGKPIATPVK
jgi:quercetin dioxygenase-like cupin family protein